MGTFYFDAGVFVTPVLRNRPPEVLERCENWLRQIAHGEVEAVTSYLTWDEVTHVLGTVPKPYDHARAQRAGALLLALDNLRFVPVEGDTIRLAQALLARLKPRDSIHAASAFLHAGGSIVTLDGDFAGTKTEEGQALKAIRLDLPADPAKPGGADQ